jgi:hypothetical protein
MGTSELCMLGLLTTGFTMRSGSFRALLYWHFQPSRLRRRQRAVVVVSYYGCASERISIPSVDHESARASG